MTRSSTLTIRISPEMRSQLDFVAEHTRRSRSAVAEEAVSRLLLDEAEIIAGIRKAQDEIEAGHGIPHETAMRSIRAAIAAAKDPKAE